MKTEYKGWAMNWNGAGWYCDNRRMAITTSIADWQVSQDTARKVWEKNWYAGGWASPYYLETLPQEYSP